MNDTCLNALADELEKIGFMEGLWKGITSLFQSDTDKAKSRVDYFFSPKAGPDKWDKFAKNVKSKEFVAQLAQNPNADPTLVQHAEAMHDLENGKTVGKILSSRLPGKSYEIKETGRGLACTCPDWKFVGSLRPGYKCKHVTAHEQGLAKAS
jgi:hypothetical protein